MYDLSTSNFTDAQKSAEHVVCAYLRVGCQACSATEKALLVFERKHPSIPVYMTRKGFYPMNLAVQPQLRFYVHGALVLETTAAMSAADIYRKVQEAHLMYTGEQWEDPEYSP